MSDDPRDDLAKMQAARAQASRHLPVTYVDKQSGRQFVKPTPLATITEDEVRRYGKGGHTCGECAHFERGHAQAEMARARFVRALVKDYEWNPRHAGLTQERVDEIGLCADAGDMATGVFMPACEHFREDRGRLKKQATPEQRGMLIKDMRAGARDAEARFRKFKRDHGLEDARIVED